MIKISGARRVPSLSFEKFRKVSGPIIDIRSPKEYEKGHWPDSKNIPLFSDEERKLIGITYKKVGQQEAFIKGIEFVRPKLQSIKEELSEVFSKEKSENSFNNNLKLRIYCWRGGMRSKSVVWLANQLGINSVQLQGGYKSYRSWVLNQFKKEWPLHLIGGRTGTGKTKLLLSLSEKDIFTIDLEGLANHRGSSFGGLGYPPQPSTEQYENLLAELLDKSTKTSSKAIWVEDEGPNLGKCRIPKGITDQMKSSPVLEIIKTQEERVIELVYVYGSYSADELKEATLRIKKRLGPQRTQKALEAIMKNDLGEACRIMLDYYDRCYDYQLSKIEKIQSIDLSGLDIETSAKLLLKKGLVY